MEVMRAGMLPTPTLASFACDTGDSTDATAANVVAIRTPTWNMVNGLCPVHRAQQVHRVIMSSQKKKTKLLVGLANEVVLRWQGSGCEDGVSHQRREGVWR